ncbi:MAG: hypothetical protein JW768_11505 [Chitinispirillaceae bacterium]|nr:hypothetical protein [Chitinispirillaceae bacterium]
MRKSLRRTWCILISIAVFHNAGAIEGFYKDVFVDEGTDLSGPSRMPALTLVNFTHEWMEIAENTDLQTSIMTRNLLDENGVLLYPDNEPRFAIVYYHGGSMGHYADLGGEGQRNVRAHYYNGGSQFGSCAGSYLLTRSYFNLWPGRINGPNTSGDRVRHLIPAESPLHNYFDFGPDNVVVNIVHNNGGSFNLSTMPEGTVVLAIHDSVPKNPEMVGYGAIYAWKAGDTTGRAVGITSHPEGSSATDQRNEMGAILLYLKDGLAPPPVKRDLVQGEQVVMNKTTADNDPLHAKIGDLQYHHFRVALPFGARSLSLTLDADEGFDMHLFARKDTFAFADSAAYANTELGPDKVLTMESVPAGIWYIGVKCATTVTSAQVSSGDDRYYEYTGRTEVLNGVAYSLTAAWQAAGIAGHMHGAARDRIRVAYNGKAITIRLLRVKAQRLSVYDLRGRQCWETVPTASCERYAWKPESKGLYLVRLETAGEVVTKRVHVTR